MLGWMVHSPRSDPRSESGVWLPLRWVQAEKAAKAAAKLQPAAGVQVAAPSSAPDTAAAAAPAAPVADKV